MNYYAHNRTTDGRYVVSNTALGYLKNSPFQFKAFCDGLIKFDTPSMRLGRQLHEAVLEPEKFNQLFELKLPYKGQGIKERRAEQVAKAEEKGIILLSEAEFETLKGIIGSLSQSAFIRDMLRESVTEQDFYFEIDGIPCKSKIDVYKVGEFVADFKFVQSANPKDFTRKAKYNYNYDRQIAFYFDALVRRNILQKESKAYFVAVEKTPPYDFCIIEVDSTILKQGREKYEKLLEQYKNTVAKGLFPKYEQHLWKDEYAADLPQEEALVMNPEAFKQFVLGQINTAKSSIVDDVKKEIDKFLQQEKPKAHKAKLLNQWKPKQAYFGEYINKVRRIKEEALLSLGSN